MPTIKFQFVADRFGFIPGSDPLKIEYARKADRALTYWETTVAELFGDASTAFDAAIAARILPQYPSRSTTSKALDVVHAWLSDLPPRRGECSRLRSRSSIRRRRTPLNSFVSTLGAIREWARLFRAALWVASVGARARSSRILRRACCRV